MSEPTSIEIQHFHLWDKIRDKHVPLSFDVEITARCNNDCRHCYINLPPNDPAARACELSVEEISGIADQAVKLGAVWCLITGGEPLLRPDFPEIYMLLKRKGLIVSVFTNATLVSQEHIALFKKYPPRDIEVTVYGVTRETYERVTRTSHTLDKFNYGLNLLIDNGVRVRLKAMAIQANYAEQAEIAAFCRARTKDYFRFDPQLHLRFDGDQVRNNEIREERLTPEQILAQERADEQRMDTLQNQCKSLAEKGFVPCSCDRLFHCGAGNGSFNVSYDGKFRLCSSLWAPETIYDLRHGTLAEAWHDFVPRVRNLRSTREELAVTCRVCPLVNICLWCPAHAHLETGAMDGSTPYFCSVAHARHAALVRGGTGG